MTLLDALPVEGKRVAVLALNGTVGWERTDGRRSVTGGCVADSAVRNAESDEVARLQCMSVMEKVSGDQRNVPHLFQRWQTCYQQKLW